MSTGLIRSTAGRVLALCLICMFSVAQALELGAISMAHMPSRPMASITFSTSARAFTSFAGRVGGVAFTNTATSADGSSVIGIVYDAQAADGRRMHVKVKTADGNMQVLSVDAPDWIHIPLARLVSSNATGAVTLFGELEDKALERKLKDEQNAMIASYHPALENTLLGLRLLQADMLVIEKNATDLFKEKGQYILGKNEVAPTQQDLQRNQAGFMAIQKWIARQPENFTSYITGDVGSKIQYSVAGDNLKITGTPNWYCWRRDRREIDAIIQRNAQSLSPDAYVLFSLAGFRQRLETAVEKRIKTMQVKHQEDRAASLLALKAAKEEALNLTADDILSHAKLSANPSIINIGELQKARSTGDTQKIANLFSDAGNKEEEMQKAPAWARIKQEFEAMRVKDREAMDQLNAIQMKKYSQSLSAEIRKAGRINPTVYNTLQKSVQIAAVMRAAKAADPAAYNQYVTSIAQVPLSLTNPPRYVLQTPTVYPRAEHVE